MSKSQEIIGEIKADKSLEPLSKLFESEVSFEDARKAVVFLYHADKEIQGKFSSLYYSHSFGVNQVIDYLNVFKKIDSKEEAKTIITNELVKNDVLSPFFDDRMDLPGAAFQRIYKSLLEIINDLGENEASEPFREKAFWFEDASIDLMLDSDIYFSKAFDSKFLGDLVSWDMPNKESPFVKNGRHVDKVLNAIKLEEIVNGKITEGDFNYKLTSENKLYKHQCEILQLLGKVETDSKPGTEFWLKVAKNPSFMYDVFNRSAYGKDDEVAGKLLPKVLKYLHKQRTSKSNFKHVAHLCLKRYFMDQVNYNNYGFIGSKAFIVTYFKREKPDRMGMVYIEVGDEIKWKNAEVKPYAKKIDDLNSDVSNLLLKLARKN